MSQVHGGVKSKSSAKRRRQRALERIEAQLKSGVKQPKGTVLTLDKVVLTEHDRKRLEKEIATLKGRV